MKIGILGGTFDPVHLGHVEIARQALEELELDELIVVPAKRQPFKLDFPVSDAATRLEMLKIAFQDVPRVVISDYELNKDEVSYTINTLNAFKQMHPKDEIWFLLGTDSLLKIEIWMNAKELLTRFNLIVGSRPGYKEEELDRQIRHLEQTYMTRIHKLTNKKLNISSTEIKKRIAQGKKLDKLVPLAVERYIIQHALYK